MQETRKGMLMVISGPSGAGKGTLAKRLLAADRSFAFSVSVTTRACRPTELPDVDYHFISEAEYDKLLAEDAFLEHATVHGHRYGTLKSEVLERIARGEDVLLDIDQQGALSVMEKMPDCVSVFIMPPSYLELRRRLVTRNTEDPAEIERRLRNAPGEIAKAPRYRYIVVNDDQNLAFAQLMNIAEAEKHATIRYLAAPADDVDTALAAYAAERDK